MTLVKLIAWLKWVDQARDDRDRERRARRVRDAIFPLRLAREERARREKLLEEAGEFGPGYAGAEAVLAEEPEGEVQAPEGQPAPPQQPLPPPKRWEGLISSSKTSYRRAMLHDGTYDEVKRYRDVARSSPFDADNLDAIDPPKPKRRGPTAETVDDDLPRRPR